MKKSARTVGPSGNGRYGVTGQIVNLNFTSVPTTFTGAQLLPMLPSFEQQVASKIGDGTDPSISGIQVVKQSTSAIEDPKSTEGYGIHTSVGVQREVYKGLVLSSDYIMRRFVHFGVGNGSFYDSIDRNQFSRPLVPNVGVTGSAVSFVRNPVIPLCTTAQSLALNPADDCSSGTIPIVGSGANSRYQALDIKLDKRFAHGIQLLATYVYQKETGFIVSSHITISPARTATSRFLLNR